jgi:predicted dehydrogenase
VSLRAAIAGTGFIARVHTGVLRSLGVELAAVCSRSGSTDMGVPAYDDLAELLRAEHVDVLHVCTPNTLHAEQVLLALERGVHVVCEKPLAVSAEESARMVEAAEAGGLVGATCFHVRGYPLVERMRIAVAAGEIGGVRVVHGRYFCDDAVRALGGWRLDPELSGPSYVTADLGAHWLDLAEHVSGRRITHVLAEFHRFAGGPLEDDAALSLRFDGGSVGSARLSALAAGRKNQLLFECEGERGGFTWDQERPDELLHRLPDESTRLVLKDESPLALYPAGHAEGYGEAFRNVLANAYRAIAGEPHAPFPTFADGHRNVRVLEAAVASAASGTWTEIVP